MPNPIRVWTCAAIDPVYASGGWASLRQAGGDLTAAAGGDRRTSVGRMALAGLAAALRGLPPLGRGSSGVAVEIHTANLELSRFATLLTALGKPDQGQPPAKDLDLWAEISAAAAGRRLTVVHTAVEPRTPMAFVGAWADFSKDKAKMAGAFTAPIPKANLAKVMGLEPA